MRGDVMSRGDLSGQRTAVMVINGCTLKSAPAIAATPHHNDRRYLGRLVQRRSRRFGTRIRSN